LRPVPGTGLMLSDHLTVGDAPLFGASASAQYLHIT
jgi:hypothetical protein